MNLYPKESDDSKERVVKYSETLPVESATGKPATGKETKKKKAGSN